MKRRSLTVTRPTDIGNAHITLSTDKDDLPFEVFVRVGKAGSDIAAYNEAIGRLVSLALQLYPDSQLPRRQVVERIVEQLEGIGGPHSGNVCNQVAAVLRDEWLEGRPADSR